MGAGFPGTGWRSWVPRDGGDDLSESRALAFRFKHKGGRETYSLVIHIEYWVSSGGAYGSGGEAVRKTKCRTIGEGLGGRAGPGGGASSIPNQD